MASAPVPTQTTYAHIHTRSPFYINFSTSETAATMEVKIWVGNQTANYPSTPQYTLVKRATDGEVVFEIAELIRDYIDQTTVLTSGCVWVQTEITDGTTTETVDYVADEGYLIYSEAVQTATNVNDDSLVLLPEGTNGMRVMVPEGGSSVIPFRPMAENALDWDYEKFDQNGNSLGITAITFNDMANSRIQYATVTDNVSRVEFDFDTPPAARDLQIVYIDVLRCSKFDTVELIYVNKLGGKSYFPFILKHIENIDVNSKRFNASTMNYATLSASQGLHVANRYVTDVTQEFTLNTDWIDEYYVQQFEEMMVSETVWMRKGGVVTSVILKTNKMQRKTHLNDKLINYTVKVQLATNYINDLR